MFLARASRRPSPRRPFPAEPEPPPDLPIARHSHREWPAQKEENRGPPESPRPALAPVLGANQPSRFQPETHSPHAAQPGAKRLQDSRSEPPSLRTSRRMEDGRKTWKNHTPREFALAWGSAARSGLEGGMGRRKMREKPSKDRLTEN